MRLLRRNTTVFEYLPHIGDSDLDEEDRHTGEFHPIFGDPVQYRGNISVPSGKAEQVFYGEEIRYTHVLVLDKPEADIREEGRIRCKGHEYDIEAVRPSLNVLSIALRRRSEAVREVYVS